jgi:hypothetical protein
MATPAPSPLAWPLLVGGASFFFPAIAAWATGRSLLRDPAGQIAGTLLLVGTCAFLALGQALGLVPKGVPLTAISSSLAPLLLLVPLLTWIGGAAPRWRPVAQGAVAGALLLAALLLGTGREFRLVTAPLISLGLTALCATALARTVRGTGPTPAASDGRALILGALVTYYFTALMSRPLIETLIARDRQAGIDAHMGLQLVYAGCMTVVAWGVSRRAAAAPLPTLGPEPTRTPATPPAPQVAVPTDAYSEPKRPAAQRQAV